MFLVGFRRYRQCPWKSCGGLLSSCLVGLIWIVDLRDAKRVSLQSTLNCQSHLLQEKNHISMTFKTNCARYDSNISLCNREKTKAQIRVSLLFSCGDLTVQSASVSLDINDQQMRKCFESSHAETVQENAILLLHVHWRMTWHDMSVGIWSSSITSWTRGGGGGSAAVTYWGLISSGWRVLAGAKHYPRFFFFCVRRLCSFLIDSFMSSQQIC